MPISLNANFIYTNLTNLIITQQNLNIRDLKEQNDFIQTFKDVDIPFGDQKVVYAVDKPTVDDYTKSSTLLAVVDADVREQPISISERKKIPLSVNNVYLSEVLLTEGGLATLSGLIIGSMEDAKIIHISEVMVALITLNNPTQAEQIVTIELEDVSALTGTELKDAQTNNANKIMKVINTIGLEMSWDNTIYNDSAMSVATNPAETCLVMNQRFANSILVDSLSTLLQSDKMENEINKRFSKMVIIPEIKLDVAIRGTYIGTLTDKRKFQFGYGYQTHEAFWDGSNLSQNNFLHFSIYADVVQFVNGVKLVASFV